MFQALIKMKYVRRKPTMQDANEIDLVLTTETVTDANEINLDIMSNDSNEIILKPNDANDSNEIKLDDSNDSNEIKLDVSNDSNEIKLDVSNDSNEIKIDGDVADSNEINILDVIQVDTNEINLEITSSTDKNEINLDRISSNDTNEIDLGIGIDNDEINLNIDTESSENVEMKIHKLQNKTSNLTNSGLDVRTYQMWSAKLKAKVLNKQTASKTNDEKQDEEFDEDEYDSRFDHILYPQCYHETKQPHWVYEDKSATFCKALKAFEQSMNISREIERLMSQVIYNGLYMAENSTKEVDNLQLETPENVPIKFWAQRYRLFSKFDMGIKITSAESWYSVTPEKISIHHANRVPNHYTVIDCFCGVGGNAIAFAENNKVIAIDINKTSLEACQHNAKIYDCENNIEFICGDFCH
eukprot:UN04976